MDSCPAGHPYDELNTYVDKTNRRHCKTCRRERMAQRREGTQVGYANARKTKCKRGHEYTEENTYRSKDGRRWCRTCMKANSSLQNIKRYGITPEQLVEMTESQDNRCAICQREFGPDRPRSIDHDHSCCGKDQSCGKCVRGLLCTPCNHGLGRFEDSEERLENALRYVRQHREVRDAGKPEWLTQAPLELRSRLEMGYEKFGDDPERISEWLTRLALYIEKHRAQADVPGAATPG